MQKTFCLFLIAGLSALSAIAQKLPLNHQVYDGWQRIGERALSAEITGILIILSGNVHEEV